MSTMTPSCPWMDDRPRTLRETYLEGYLDDDLPQSERRRVEEHLAVCERCRRELADLAALLGEAHRLSAAIEPPRDLWPGIAARLEQRPAAPRSADRRPSRTLSWLPLAAAAVLLLALTAALVLRGWGPWTAPPEPGAAGAPRTETALRVSPAPSRAMGRQVLAALERQRGNLSPETVGSLEASLAALDGSIGDLRAALAEEPGNRRLHLSLAERYRQEMELLQKLQLLEVQPRERS